MSLNPAPYLQTWERSLAAAHHRYRSLYAEDDSGDGDDDETYPDLPESSSSSDSFLSRFSESSLGRRLNFYPYAGAGVTPAGVPSLEGDDGLDGQLNIGDQGEARRYKTTAAFDVDRGKRILQVCVAVVSCFLSAGIIFGFAALKSALVKEGVYRCSTESPSGPVCYRQELRLNLLFAVASATFYVSALPVVTVLAKYGPRVGSITGSFFLAVGAPLMSFGASLPFDGYILGFLCLAIGGSFIYVSSFHLANAFPTHSTLILSALTGAFDSSPAVFLIFRVINENSSQFFSRDFFLLYLAVPAFVLVMQFSIMPKTFYMTPAELVLQVDTCSPEPNGSVDQLPQRSNRTRSESIVQRTQTLLNDRSEDFSKTKDVLCNSTAAQFGCIPYVHPHRLLSGIRGLSHLLSTPFLLMAIFTALQMLQLNYFIGSISQQYKSAIPHNQGRKLTSLFDILLPIGGIASSVYARPLLHGASLPFILTLLVICATATGAMGCIPSLPIGYIHILAYVLYRPLFFVAIPEYIARTQSRFSGIAYGLLVSVAGLSNFAIPGLDAVTFKAFRGDFVPTNAFLTTASFVVGAVSVVCLRSARRGTEATGEGDVIERGLSRAIDEDAANETNTEEDGEQEPLLERVPYGGSYGGFSSL